MTALDNVTVHLPHHPLPKPVTPPHLPGEVAISRLDHFNGAPAADLQPTLLSCLRSHHWAHRITAHRPYPDLDALLAASDEAAYDLAPTDLAEALAGETLPALPEDTYEAAHTALNAAYAAYEAKFGHVFVIHLCDIPDGEALDRVLEAIRSRLANDPEEERQLAAEQLRHLARTRLNSLLRDATSHKQPTPDR
ncbi:2-oxo-4-hydroxy-4-carboxy-5-ureidoimidazoline decarboxylase [Streptomyces broussonetiae]|uniref:2-oxo-4-hydroxy-4-carboxy-5-ureidoimidazoline decarboxylase n=1 Tax=Streptomyces broussonetiae TaxID=2686304 RepID=UPI0035DFBBE4